MSDDARGVPSAEVIRGLLYTHNRANANTAAVHEASATLQAVIELLIEHGVLERSAMEQRRQAAADQLRQTYFERGMGVAMQEFDVSKYRFRGGAQIDCANRLHLCGAACCKLPLALSKEDVQEGIVRWDLGRPYMIAQGSDRYCVHLNSETHGCGVYACRPIPCRGYDCREDNRIWLDFENQVINPKINDPEWPACLEVNSDGVEHSEGVQEVDIDYRGHSQIA